MKLAFFEVEQWQIEYIKNKLRNHKILFFESELNERNAEKIKDVDGIGIFIYSIVNKEILSKLPKLKFIATMSTGFDHIDISECKKRKIKVSNVSSYGENTVAEHTIGLMISLSKKIPQSVQRTKEDNFDLSGLKGFDLKGKTLGVIGAGNIGLRVIKIAKAMEMKIFVNTKNENRKLAKQNGFRYVSLENLLKNSDIVTLHCPLTSETRHMINLHNVKIIKKGAYLINTARGGLIDTKALVYALDKNILVGAAFDVLENEDDLKEEGQMLRNKAISVNEMKTFLRNHKLLKDRDVIITPHSAFYTIEAQKRILDTTIKNILSRGNANRVG